MIKLLQAGAVPFGCDTDMSDSDFHYYSGDCGSSLDISWRHNHHQDADGFRLLPDIITSNTPPPSPLRRSRSCLAFFHEKDEAQTCLAPLATPSIQLGSDTEMKARLSHIHEVGRHVQCDASTITHVPHLSWVLPRLPSPSHRPGNHGEEGRWTGREDDEARERRRLWRHIGGDLRKMADQFQVNRSSVSAKGSAEVVVPTTGLSTILSRCLAGSLICLVAWRLCHGSR